MKMVWALTVALVITAAAAADGRCFCDSYTYTAPYQQPFYYSSQYDVEKVEVINRQVAISPLAAPVKNHQVDQLLRQQWQTVTGAIPISPRKDYLRRFQFTKNWPTVAPQRAVQRQQQQVQSQTITQILYGVVQQNVVVQGGAVSLDVPLPVVTPDNR
jgi:hypothetical protein